MTYFDTKVDPIFVTLSGMERSLSTLGDHVALLEQRVGVNEDNITDLSTRVKQLEIDNKYLVDKVDNLENRSRAVNLRFLGIPEATEGRDIVGFMADLIPQLLGEDDFPTTPAIERAHRTPAQQVQSSERSRPRPILIKLLHFQDKLKILRLARGKKDLSFNGSRIFIFPDYSANLTRKRKAFDTIKRKLKDMGLEYSLRYPRTLSVTVDGEKQLFSDHKAAEAAFLSSMNSSMNSPG